MQPYDDAGSPPPNDPAGGLPDHQAPAQSGAGYVPAADATDHPFDVSGRVGGPRQGRPLAPNLLSRMMVAGLILAAVLVAAGVAFVWGDDAEKGASLPTPHPTGQQTNNAVAGQRAGIADLLARRGKAIRDHDKAAFLALIDPTAEQFRSEQSQLFDRLVHVPFSDWSYVLAGEGPALPKNRSVQLPKGSTIARVRLDYQLAGSDSQVEREQYLTVVPRGGQWLLAGNDDATASGLKTESDIWDLGPVQVVHGKQSLVLGDAPKKELQSLAAEADRGVHDVGVVWRRPWSHHPVIVFPQSQSDMATLIGNDGKGLSQIAAVTTGSFESGLSRGDRVVVNPSAWRTLGSLGRRVVLAHEITHLATRAITVNNVPIWLSEGFADYVAYRAVQVPTNVVAGDVLNDVRKGKGPKNLPEDADFDAARGDIAAAYEGAWLACRMIAERYGEKRLIALYVSYANNKSVPESGQIKATLDISEAQLVTQWRAYLGARAGA
ncbi:MAG: hypothetical protein QOD68_2221 [Actinomycetota bacterium]|nr:hypothetical protein [Actinomycetota bacterium]